jgi:hypothetical protein
MLPISKARRRLLLNGVLAVVLYFLAQLLIWGVDVVITLSHRSFGGPIAAMILVWLVMLILGCQWEKQEAFFNQWLKEPVRIRPRSTCRWHLRGTPL